METKIKKSLPRPSYDFIQAFVEKQGKIDKVLVEVICDKLSQCNCTDNYSCLGTKFKVAPDNTITIKPFEEKTSWNREELTKHSEDMLRTIAKLKDCKILTQYELKYVNDLEISVNQLLD